MRVFHRFGGAVRSVIAAGVALTGRRRRPAPSHPDHSLQAGTENPPDPARPRRKPAARRPRAAAPVAPARPARSGWLARWFGRKRPQPVRRSSRPDSDCPFTPEAYPGLSPEACAFFNTPVEDCDPNELRLVLAMLAAQIADSLPPELGMDAKALLATLSERLCMPPDEAGPDATQAAPENAVPQAEPEGALPQAASEHAPPPAAPEDTVSQAAPDAPLPPVGIEPAAVATMAPSVAREAAPDAGPQTGSAFQRRRALLAASRSFPRRRAGIRRRLPGVLHQMPARRLCYAACAGPP